MLRYPRKTYLLILGFIAGSVVTEIVKQTKDDRWPPDLASAMLAVAVVAGFALIHFVNRVSKAGQAELLDPQPRL